MVKLFKFFAVLFYVFCLTFGAISALLVFNVALSRAVRADDGSYLKLGAETGNKEYPAKLLGIGYQGKTDFWLHYQLEMGVTTNDDKSGKISSFYGDASLGLSVLTEPLYSKAFLGVGAATAKQDPITSNFLLVQNLELGLRNKAGTSVGVFLRRAASPEIAYLPPGISHLGAKLQIPL